MEKRSNPGLAGKRRIRLDVLSARCVEQAFVLAKQRFLLILPSMITVDATDDVVRVTIPREDMDMSQIEAILRPFRFTSLVAHSELSKDEAMKIAEESKSDWWEKNQHRFSGEAK